MSNAIELIAAERKRQIEQEGWTVEHDDRHLRGELADSAACYALTSSVRERSIWGQSLIYRLWPWDWNWWKPSSNDRIRELVKAGALIVAEIERLQRAEK